MKSCSHYATASRAQEKPRQRAPHQTSSMLRVVPKAGSIMFQRLLTITGIFLLLGASASAQMARKPSPTREPPDYKAALKTNRNSLPKIDSQADFDSIARIYHQ